MGDQRIIDRLTETASRAHRHFSKRDKKREGIKTRPPKKHRSEKMRPTMEDFSAQELSKLKIIHEYTKTTVTEIKNAKRVKSDHQKNTARENRDQRQSSMEASPYQIHKSKFKTLLSAASERRGGTPLGKTCSHRKTTNTHAKASTPLAQALAKSISGSSGPPEIAELRRTLQIASPNDVHRRAN